MGNVDSSGDILDSRASLLSHVACRGLGEAEGQPTIAMRVNIVGLCPSSLEANINLCVCVC